MFLTFRQITAVRFAVYAVAQLLGAFVGALITYIVYCGKAIRYFFVLFLKKSH
jgi:glycerol uptake facilitator-like aquaporin